MNRPDTEAILAGLKDFQRESVEYVDRRLHEDGVDRFLVADEVGLGKTMVARGVIAKTIDRLWGDDDHRIDIVYICSNRDIAQQNVRKLDVTGQSVAFASRMTLVAKDVAKLRGVDGRNRLNFVSFTPGTSFNVQKDPGMAEERCLLYHLLADPAVWGKQLMRRTGSRRILQGWVSSLGRFDRLLANYGRALESSGIDPELARNFASALATTELRQRFEDLAGRVARRPFRTGDETVERNHLIGELRGLLAAQCVDALEPDLVILDEFQRFRDILTDDSEAGALAQALIGYEGNKTLMLSATPYKAYTLAGEADDDHHADFISTARFLLDGEGDEFEASLKRLRLALLEAGIRPVRDLDEACRTVERHLRSAMSRVERLSSRVDPTGMLREAVISVDPPRVDDVAGFVSLDHVARAIHAGGMVEYWKSAPCFFNFLEGYKIAEKLERAMSGGPDAARLRADVERAPGQIDWAGWEQYQPIDSGNARFRALEAEMIDSGACELLWLPPSLPYYELEGPWAKPGMDRVTKRLIFSAWNAAPKAIASLLSYGADRHLSQLRNPSVVNTERSRQARRGRLTFARDRDSGRLRGMPALALVTPSVTLARLGAHRGLAANLFELVSVVEERVEDALRSLPEGAADGPEDEAWYWAAPLLLDDVAGDGRIGDAAPSVWAGDDDGAHTLFKAHLDQAREMVAGETPLGRRPDGLARVLSELAVGGPANAAYRALVDAGGDLEAAWHGAARAAWGFRALFNLPEVTPLLQSLYGDPYWQAVAKYCAAGGLNAVLDEYVHVLAGWEGVDPDGDGARELGRLIADAVSVDSTRYTAHDPVATRGEDAHRMRCRFALRFGDQRSSAEAGERSVDVRRAFNSPFWPFVLASTSVGQEGLDFHLYCHAVVHWNLPPNPVDLEQREGRVHRFKGHAVRRNVADDHREVGLAADRDPWEAMWSSAEAAKPADENDLVPYWIYPGRHHIERHVPVIPLSREVRRYEDLKSSTALYRMVFGQPRQEDLLNHLRSSVPEERLAQLAEVMRVDLRPPPLNEPRT